MESDNIARSGDLLLLILCFVRARSADLAWSRRVRVFSWFLNCCNPPDRVDIAQPHRARRFLFRNFSLALFFISFMGGL